MESKEQLSDPTLLPIHHQHLHLDHDASLEKRKREHSSLLPAIRQQPHNTQHSRSRQVDQPPTQLPLRRPHSADSSTQSYLHPIPSALAPLFSSSHRVTAGGFIIHVSDEEAMAAPVVEVESREVETTAGGVAGAGRERIIWLEPIGVKAKVDSGLSGKVSGSSETTEEAAQQQVDGWGEEEKRQRRRRRTEQRQLERVRQQQLQQQQSQQSVTHPSAEEEKIQTEASQQLSLSPSDWLVVVERRRLQGELDEALANVVLERASGIDTSTPVASAHIQAGLYEAVMAAADNVQLFSARDRSADVAHDQVSLDQLTGSGRRRLHHRHRRRKRAANGGGLKWSDDMQPSSLLPDEQPEWTYSVRIAADQSNSDSSDEEDQSEGGGRKRVEDSNDGSDSTQDEYSSDSDVGDGEHDDKLTAEQRVGIALTRMQQDSRPPSSQLDSASSSRPVSASSANSSRPTSASRTSHAARGNARHNTVTFSTSPADRRSHKNASHRRHATSTSATRQKPSSTASKSKKQLETDLMRVKQQQRDKSAVQSLFDPRPVILCTGDAIDRSIVYTHHASDVQLVVDMMDELTGGGATMVLASPISIHSVAERAAGMATSGVKADAAVAGDGAAVVPKRGGTSDSQADKRKEGKNAPSTTVLHGKDMMIVSSWVVALARRYLAEVMGEKLYAEPAKTELPPADAALSDAPSQDAAASEAVAAVAKPSVPALERLTLDRRTLYTMGLTHERIDQLYSGLYAYSSGFYQLLYGFAQPNVPPTSSLSPALFLHRLWLAYLRLIELSHPALYLYSLAAVQRLSGEETDALYKLHLKDVERSDVAVCGRREEVRVLKEEYGRTNELYEDTLDGVSEARVTLMAMRETNWREEQQLSEVSDEAIADLTAKANRALSAQQMTYDNNVRVRERRALIVKTLNTARADIHLAHLHHDDMTRSIAERSEVIVQVRGELPGLQTRAEEAERCGCEAAALAAATRLVSYKLLALNSQVLAITAQQCSVIDRVRQLGLTAAFEADEWPIVLAEVSAAHEEAQSFLTEHVPGQSALLDGVNVAELERQVGQMISQQGRLTDELKARMGLDVFEREMQQRVAAAQAIHADSTRALASLTATITDYRQQLKEISDAYRLVYVENESYLLSNGKLQAEVDGLLARLEQLIPQQEVKRASIAASRAATDDMRERCGVLPGQIEELKAATLALVPRQTELSAVEATKGEVYRALQDEKDKLDREWVRSRRNEDELKAEMIELDAQLADMESKCQPLWQELDGKLGVLEREIEFKRQEWEQCGMRLCEEEQRIEWRVEAVQASEERLRPVQQELSEAQAAADEVRAVLAAKQAIQDEIRIEMREMREQMQAKTREKEDFLARHVKDNQQFVDTKAAHIAHIAHLTDTLQHNKNELRASHSVNEQMTVAHDKRLQQWNSQLDGRKEALRKKREIDQQRRDVQAVKRAEMLAARDAVRTDCEKQQQRQRELEELLAMTEQELQQEQATTAEMERTTERLRRLHVNLSSAAPHLQHELDRVTGKDRHFDLREVERAVQTEMERQHVLIQRLTQLEEEEWTRRLNRTERWIQTDPSRHFKSLKDELDDGSRERYVLGVEMELMDQQWVSERQQQMEIDERRAEMAPRQRRSGIIVHSPANASQASTSRRGRSYSIHTSHISPALAAFSSSSSPGYGAMPTAAQTWATSLRSSAHAPHATGHGEQQPHRGRQRAGSVSVAQPTLSSTAQLDPSAQLAVKARRGHARTQTMLPVGWQHSGCEAEEQVDTSAAPFPRPRASTGSVSDKTDFASQLSSSSLTRTGHYSATSSLSLPTEADDSFHGGRNLTSRSVNREQQARESEQSGSVDSEPRTVLSALVDSSRRNARTPSPQHIDPLSTTQRSRSPLLPSRPHSAAASALETAALTPQHLPQQPKSPQSATGWSDDSSARTLSRPTTAHSGNRSSTSSPQSALSTLFTVSTGRHAASSRYDRPTSAQRSRSPVPASTQLSAATMIPESAMRPLALTASKANRLSKHTATSQQQAQQLQMSGGTDRAEEKVAAHGSAAAQPKPLREVVEEKDAPQSGQPAKRRTVVQVPTLPLQRTGTLSEWIEQQMRLSADLDTVDNDKRKQAAGTQPQHRLLALSLPDQSQPASKTDVEPTSPAALLSTRRLAIVPDNTAAPQTVAAAIRAILPAPSNSLDASPAQQAQPPHNEVQPMIASSSPSMYSLAMDSEPPRAFAAAVEAFTRKHPKEVPVPQYVPLPLVPEDEMPGRVPKYIKRSIARKYAERRQR